MDISIYKAWSYYLGIVAILSPLIFFVIQLVSNYFNGAEKRAFLSFLPGALTPDQNGKIRSLEKKASYLSYINSFLFISSFISGALLFYCNNAVQDNLESSLNGISQRQNHSDKKEEDFEKITNNRLDYLSIKIKGDTHKALTDTQKKAFKTLESLGDKKICLVQVGFERETADFYNDIEKSILSYDTHLILLTMGSWMSMNYDGENFSENSHHRIEVFDPAALNGDFYKAIKESGLPTNLIPQLPLGCRGADYGLVIGRN